MVTHLKLTFVVLFATRRISWSLWERKDARKPKTEHDYTMAMQITERGDSDFQLFGTIDIASGKPKQHEIWGLRDSKTGNVLGDLQDKYKFALSCFIMVHAHVLFLHGRAGEGRVSLYDPVVCCCASVQELWQQQHPRHQRTLVQKS